MSESEAPSKHHTILSILIALAATTGALVSWHASKVGGAASGEDAKAIAAALDEAAAESNIASDIFINMTNTIHFQIHRDNSRAAQEELNNAAVREAGRKNTSAGFRWIYERFLESALANARLPYLNFDFLKTEGGRRTFDRERYYQARRSELEMEKALDPAPFIERSAAKRREANLLVSLNALFAAAIFCFTAALKIEQRGKLVWTAVGALMYLAGAGLALARVLA